MKTIVETLEKIKQYPVIPVYYHDDVQISQAIIQAAYDGGIRVFEYVNRGPKALENFQVLKAFCVEHLPELSLGIGTIKSAAQAQAFLELDADFIVSPIVKAEIAPLTLAKDILWIPGCMTPTEINQAADLGAPLVKLFPGSLLGPDYLKAIKPLFRDMLFMPTGGVNPDETSIANWFKAGVVAVGMGSKLFEKPAGSEGYNWLADKSKDVMAYATSFKK